MSERRDDETIEFRVRAALQQSGPPPTARVLARIRGRSPRQLDDAASAVIARRVALAATVLLTGLTFAGRDATGNDRGEGLRAQDAPFFAVVAPDDSEIERKAPVETLVAELFATEVPE